MVRTLHIYNPDNDMALANDDENYQSPAHIVTMKRDMAMLPAWWAAAGDSVLLPIPIPLRPPLISPSVQFITHPLQADYQKISPWGWNKALRKQLMLAGVPTECLPNGDALCKMRTLSSRLQAVQMLPTLQLNPQFCGTSIFCTTEQAVVTALKAFPQSILKAPHSCSGKGLRRGEGTYQLPLSGWCRRILRTQGGVVVEPLYQRVCDFAMEFSVQNETPTFLGYAITETDGNGAYKGNLLSSCCVKEDYLATMVERTNLHLLREKLMVALKEWLQGSSYEGYVGVDMMICAFHDEPYRRIHPCVEINLRTTMGVVAHRIYERFVASGSEGELVVKFYKTSVPLMAAHQRFTQTHPLQCVNGKITQGYCSLTPIESTTCYHTYILIRPIV